MTQPDKITSLARKLVPEAIRGVVILVCLTAGSIAVRAANKPYDAIYVFGDSFSDVGNVYLFTKGTLPLSTPGVPGAVGPYFNGRFSNGPIWVEHLAGDRGMRLYPSTDAVHHGTDYAWGGASVTIPGNGTTIPPSIPEQVGTYLANDGGHADANALYIISGGGNDILGLGSSGISADLLGWRIAQGIADSIKTLRRAGARNFLLPEISNLGRLPAVAVAGPAAVAFATEASLAINRDLDRILGYESFDNGVRIYRLRGYNLFEDIAADSAPAAYSTPTTPVPGLASHFGFTNIAIPCLTPPVCGDPDHTLFWDGEHFTEFGHAFIALAAEAALSGEPERFADFDDR